MLDAVCIVFLLPPPFPSSSLPPFPSVDPSALRNREAIELLDSQISPLCPVRDRPQPGSRARTSSDLTPSSPSSDIIPLYLSAPTAADAASRPLRSSATPPPSLNLPKAAPPTHRLSAITADHSVTVTSARNPTNVA